MKIKFKDILTMIIAIIIIAAVCEQKIAIFGIGLILFIFVFTHVYGKHQDQKTSDFIDVMKKGLEESIKEIQLIRSSQMPTDEDILLYYKMYCKKLELKDEWTTKPPMTFEAWKKEATSNLDTYGGYKFMIPLTMDAMVGFPPNVTFHRYRDYKSMVLKDEREENAC